MVALSKIEAERIADLHDKRFDRIEHILDKQTEIHQQIANAISTLNHNSTAIKGVMDEMKTVNMKMASKNDSWQKDIIKILISCIVSISGAVIAIKTFI